MDKLEYERYLALHSMKYKRPRPELITLPKDHPFYCMTYKGRVAKARILMAEHLGRPLTRNEIVCYKDDFPLNTDISNLELRDRQYIWEDAIEWGLDSDAQDSEAYRLGKVEEERIATHLASLSYHVTDISKSRHYNSDGTVIYSPYDIYAWSENYSFLADIKYRSSIGDIYFKDQLMNLYLSYWNQLQVSSKIIIVATPNLDDSFIDIADIICSGNQCIIERWKTQPITLLGIRKEDGYLSNHKLRFLHMEPCQDSPSGYKVLGTFPYPQSKLDNG